MARKRVISRRRIGVGVIVLIFLVAVIMSGGQDLNLANPFAGGLDFLSLLEDPFAGGLDFQQTELQYSLFALADISQLRDFIAGTDADIRNKTCFLKMHQSAELEGGNIIALDSAFQTFGALTPFALQTTAGANIQEFRNIELRMRCDSIPIKSASCVTGNESTCGQHEFEVVPRASNPLFITIRGYNQQGQLVELKGIDLKPVFELGGLAYFTNQQVDFVVNPPFRIKFANEPTVQDPLKPAGNGLFTTSERTISKSVRISAIDLENAIEKSTVLEPKTFTSEIRFNIHGAFDIDFPDLNRAGVLSPRQIPVDTFLLENKMTVQVTEFTQTGGGFNFFPDQKTQITKLEPVNSIQRFVIDGTNTNKNLKVYVTLDNYDRNTEGSVKGFIIKTADTSGRIIATTGLGCGFPVSTTGSGSTTQSNFICNFNVVQTTPVGDYTISIGTSSTDRVQASKSFLIVLEGAPVGGTDGCPDGYERSIDGSCVLFGTTGTGTGVFGCPAGQILTDGVCIVPTGGTGGGTVDPCPIQGEVRDILGTCRLTIGSGGVGTKSCFACENADGERPLIRVIRDDDSCPVFQCDDGTTTAGTEIMNCSDNKPADIVGGQQTCNRVVGILGGFLPILVDCEGENRTADIEKGEICVPAFIIGLFENLPLLIGVVIVLIIFIAIIVAIVKRTPAGRAVTFATGGGFKV